MKIPITLFLLKFVFLFFFVRGTLLPFKKNSLGLAIIVSQLNDFTAVETVDINFFEIILIGNGTELSCAGNIAVVVSES